MRTTAVRCRARWAALSPAGLSRCRLVLPLLAGIGLAAHNAANAAAECSRAGLLPAVTRNWPACSRDPEQGGGPRCRGRDQGFELLVGLGDLVGERLDSPTDGQQRRHGGLEGIMQAMQVGSQPGAG